METSEDFDAFSVPLGFGFGNDKTVSGLIFLPVRINLIFNIVNNYIIFKAVLAASCSASCLLAPDPEAAGFPLTTTSAVKPGCDQGRKYRIIFYRLVN